MSKDEETKRKRASRQEAGALGKRDAYMYDPETLVLVTDEKSPLYDERVHLPVNEKLVANIKFQPDGPDGAPLGVIKPIVVRRNPETGKIEVVDGRQRVKAAREANKQLRKEGRDPIRVTTVTDRGRDSRLIGISISANEFAQDETPSGRARKIQKYIDHGHDKKEAANMFGVSEATIVNTLRVKHAEAFVMLGGESEHSHAALFENIRPSVRIEAHRVPGLVEGVVPLPVFERHSQVGPGFRSAVPD